MIKLIELIRMVYDTLQDIGAIYLSETLMRGTLTRKGLDVPDVVRPYIPVRGSTAVACRTGLDVRSGMVPVGRAQRPVVPRKNNANFDFIAVLRMKHFPIP